MRCGGKLNFRTHTKLKEAVAAAYASKDNVTASDVVARCKVWCPIFCPGKLRSKKGAEDHKVPGDAEALHTQAVTPATVKMFQQEACTIQSSIQLKYPFGKTALVRAWKSECKRKFRRVTVNERAVCMRRVLTDVANQLGKATLNEHQTAAEFMGKRVSRVQGPVQFLRAYKIITKVTKAWVQAIRKRLSTRSWYRLLQILSMWVSRRIPRTGFATRQRSETLR